jgi:hypothetical protein
MSRTFISPFIIILTLFLTAPAYAHTRLNSECQVFLQTIENSTSESAVKMTLRFLVAQSELDHKQKANVWRKAIPKFAVLFGSFISEEFNGSDGSIVFIGHHGTSVIFKPSGEVIRGTIHEYYQLNQGDVWRANYDRMTVLGLTPAEDRKVESAKAH